MNLDFVALESNNFYFVNNEQASLAFTDVFCFAHAKHNLIKLII